MRPCVTLGHEEVATKWLREDLGIERLVALVLLLTYAIAMTVGVQLLARAEWARPEHATWHYIAVIVFGAGLLQSRKVAGWLLMVLAIPLVIDGLPMATVPWGRPIALRGPLATSTSVAGFAELSLGLLGLVLICAHLARRARDKRHAGPADD